MNKIFSKCSIERDDRFAIITDIIHEADRFYVIKRPYSESANEHINNLVNIYNMSKKIYKDSKDRYISCEKIEDGVSFEYVEGETLETKVDSLILVGEIQKALKLIDDYICWILNFSTSKRFEVSDGFKSVFGDSMDSGNIMCSLIGNIDLIMSNVIINNGYNIIDYEWTFDFDIPTKFIIYRLLYDYIYCNEVRFNTLNKYKLFDKYHISESDQKCFKLMEENFQKYIRGNKKVHSDFEKKLRKNNSFLSDKKVNVLVDCGYGYNNLYDKYDIIQKKDGMILDFNIEDNVRGVILSLDTSDCIVRIDGVNVMCSPDTIVIENKYYILKDNESQLALAFNYGEKKILAYISIVKAEHEFIEALYLKKDIDDKQKSIYDEEVKKLKIQLEKTNNELFGQEIKNKILIEKLAAM